MREKTASFPAVFATCLFLASAVPQAYAWGKWAEPAFEGRFPKDKKIPVDTMVGFIAHVNLKNKPPLLRLDVGDSIATLTLDNKNTLVWLRGTSKMLKLKEIENHKDDMAEVRYKVKDGIGWVSSVEIIPVSKADKMGRKVKPIGKVNIPRLNLPRYQPPAMPASQRLPVTTAPSSMHMAPPIMPPSSAPPEIERPSDSTAGISKPSAQTSEIKKPVAPAGSGRVLWFRH